MSRRTTRDEHVPGASDAETLTRRRLMTTGAHATGAIATAAILLPALGFAAGPIFRRETARWEPIGRAGDFPDDTYVTKVITIEPGVGEAGKTTIFVRRRNPRIDLDPADRWNRFLALPARRGAGAARARAPLSRGGLPGGFKGGGAGLRVPLPWRRLRPARASH